MLKCCIINGVNLYLTNISQGEMLYEQIVLIS